jgi:hypothetical protein
MKDNFFTKSINVPTQVDTLRPVVARAVRLVKEGLVCAYNQKLDCLPQRPQRVARNVTRSPRAFLQ